MRRSILVLVSVATVTVGVYADPNSELFKAAQDGSLVMVRQALDNGANVNALDGHGNSAVVIATSGSHSSALKYLLEKGGNPNIRMRSTYRELFSTSDSDKKGADRVAVVRRLLEAGANRAVVAKFPLIVERNVTDSNATVASRQMTPLMVAAIRGNVECVALLLAAGADVNAKSFEGYTPLMFAVLRYPFRSGVEDLGSTVADLVDSNSPMADLVRAEQ